MRRNCLVFTVVAIASSLTVVSTTRAAQIWVTGVLEENAAKYSRCVAMSEDGVWVVGNSKQTEAGSGAAVDTPFSWSRDTGLRELTTTATGDNYVTGCASTFDGQLLACGNIGGMARKWESGTWWILPANPAQPNGNARSVYAMSYEPINEETWIVGSSFPAENEKAYRYSARSGAFIDFWGYYQDAYGVARNGWAVG